MTGTPHGHSGAGARSDRPRADRSGVLAALREQASDETLAQMGPRYGIHTGESLGVPMAAMKRVARDLGRDHADRKSTRLNSSHSQISYAVFCLKKKKLTRYAITC